MTSGVYIMTNKINRRRFIGYSENLEYRFEDNRKVLQNGKFTPKHILLIDDYQQFGEEAFICGILEVTVNDSSLMEQRARYWRRIIQPEYNQ
jgi:group I intron endonuclease